MKTRGKRTCAAAALATAASIACCAPRSAAAAGDPVLEIGADVGVARRGIATPGYDPGLAVGVGVEGALLPFLFVGPYFLHDAIEPDTSPSSAFNTFGGRVRLTLPKAGLKPYALAGLGITFVEYGDSEPLGVFEEAPSLPRHAHFFETPVGAGLAYDFGHVAEIGAHFAVRPAFGYSGDRPPPPMVEAPIGSPYTGWSLMGGAALLF